MFTITSVKEYYEKLRVNYDELSKIADAQIIMYDSGLEQKNMALLINLLGIYSNILSLAFIAPTPLAISGIIAGLINCLGTDMIKLKELVKEGHWQLSKALLWLKNNPQYDMVEIKLPFIEYVDDFN